MYLWAITLRWWYLKYSQTETMPFAQLRTSLVNLKKKILTLTSWQSFPRRLQILPDQPWIPLFSFLELLTILWNLHPVQFIKGIWRWGCMVKMKKIAHDHGFGDWWHYGRIEPGYFLQECTWGSCRFPLRNSSNISNSSSSLHETFNATGFCSNIRLSKVKAPRRLVSGNL